MFSLVRATRGLPKAPAFHASTRVDAVTETAPWTICRSSHSAPNSSTTRPLEDKYSESSQNQDEAWMTPVSDSVVRRISTTTSSQLSFRECQNPMQPKQTRIRPTTAGKRSKTVADLTEDELNNTAPSAVPLSRSNIRKYERPANNLAKAATVNASSTREFVSVRREPVKSLPTFVVFSGLPDDTTIADILSSIREACVAGTISFHEASIVDARMWNPRAGDTSPMASVDFTEPSGAERIHSLSGAGRFTVRGLVPQTYLRRRRSIPKFPTPDGKEATYPLGGSMAAHPIEKGRYLDQLEVKDEPVRDNRSNYKRDPSAGAGDKGQLTAEAVFQSIFANVHREPKANAAYEQDWETGEAGKG